MKPTVVCQAKPRCPQCSKTREKCPGCKWACTCGQVFTNKTQWRNHLKHVEFGEFFANFSGRTVYLLGQLRRCLNACKRSAATRHVFYNGCLLTWCPLCVKPKTWNPRRDVCGSFSATNIHRTASSTTSSQLPGPKGFSHPCIPKVFPESSWEDSLPTSFCKALQHILQCLVGSGWFQPFWSLWCGKEKLIFFLIAIRPGLWKKWKKWKKSHAFWLSWSFLKRPIEPMVGIPWRLQTNYSLWYNTSGTFFLFHLLLCRFLIFSVLVIQGGLKMTTWIL